jgi:hypothetical protein
MHTPSTYLHKPHTEGSMHAHIPHTSICTHAVHTLHTYAHTHRHAPPAQKGKPRVTGLAAEKVGLFSALPSRLHAGPLDLFLKGNAHKSCHLHSTELQGPMLQIVQRYNNTGTKNCTKHMILTDILNKSMPAELASTVTVLSLVAMPQMVLAQGRLLVQLL